MININSRHIYYRYINIDKKIKLKKFKKTSILSTTFMSGGPKLNDLHDNNVSMYII